MPIIVFLIPYSDKPEHRQNAIAQSQTCFKNTPPGIEVFYLVAEGIRPPEELGKRIIVTPQPDGYFRVLDKTILAINQVMESLSPEFVVRGNTSNYYQVLEIRKYLITNANPNEHLYGGKETFVNDEMTALEAPVRYAGGTGIYLSRRTANLLRELPVADYFRIVDDVAMGHWLSVQGVPLKPLERNDVSDFEALDVALQTRVKSWDSSERTVQRFAEVDQILRETRRFLRIALNLKFFLKELSFFLSKKRADAALRLVVKFRPVKQWST